ncbi:MAG TPA: hypothetical protein VF950_21040 [Planctomycetota bacterium]
MCLCLCLALLQAAGGEISGRVVLKTGEADGALEVRGGGLRGGSGAGFPIIDGKVPLARDFGVCSWDPDKGLRLHSRNLPPGHRLVTAAWKKRVAPPESREITHYMDWRWVEVKAPNAKETVSEVVLTIEPSVSGEAEVTLAAGVAADAVAFIPADAQGKVPDWSERRFGPAFTEAVAGGKAVFRGLKPGRYVFFPAYDPLDEGPPGVFAAAEVPAQGVAKIALGEKK